MRSRWPLLLVLLIALGAVLVLLRRGGRATEGEEVERSEEPIVSPSRVLSDQGETRVVLDTGEIRRIALTTAELEAASVDAGVHLTAQVVPEPERTATVRAPVAGRLNAVEKRHWPALGETVAAGTAVGRVSDAQPLSVPIGGVITRVEARPGEIVEAGQVLLELADNSRPVVRVPWPDDVGRARDHVTLHPPGESAIGAKLIGPAPEADPLTRLPAYLYRARSRWAGAVPGTAITLSLTGEERVEGVLVPDRAVVQWEGLAWAYVQRAPGVYARVRVPTDRPARGGWVTSGALEAGDTVVLAGVQELLSEEFRSRVTVGEESGE